MSRLSAGWAVAALAEAGGLVVPEVSEPRSRRVDGGRRQSRRAGVRRVPVRVSFTPEEAERLQAMAARAKVSLSRIVAERALASERVSTTERNAERDVLLRVQRKLTGATTNLNQLAKVANATGRVPAEVGEAAAAVGRLEDELSTALARLFGR